MTTAKEVEAVQRMMRDANRGCGGIDCIMLDGIVYRRSEDGSWPEEIMETSFIKNYIQHLKDEGKLT